MSFNVMAENISIYYLSFCGYYSMEQYGWGFWLRICHEATVRMTAAAAVIWRLNEGWRSCFQNGLLTWLLAGCLTMWDSAQAAWCPLVNYACCHVNMAVNLPQSKQSKRKKGSYDAFYDLVTYCHFCHILFAVTKYSPTQKSNSTFLKEEYIKECVPIF